MTMWFLAKCFHMVILGTVHWNCHTITQELSCGYHMWSPSGSVCLVVCSHEILGYMFSWRTRHSASVSFLYSSVPGRGRCMRIFYSLVMWLVKMLQHTGSSINKCCSSLSAWTEADHFGCIWQAGLIKGINLTTLLKSQDQQSYWVMWYDFLDPPFGEISRLIQLDLIQSQILCILQGQWISLR